MKIITLLTVIQVSIFSLLSPISNINISKENIYNRYVQKADTGINEEDFINTMFLKAEFFENWSDTNYFINPTLKTSKPLKYNKKWYLDYMKDSFKTDKTNERPKVKFLQLWKNWNQEIDNILDQTNFINEDSKTKFSTLFKTAGLYYPSNLEIEKLKNMMQSIIYMLVSNYTCENINLKEINDFTYEKATGGCKWNNLEAKKLYDLNIDKWRRSNDKLNRLVFIRMFVLRDVSAKKGYGKIYNDDLKKVSDKLFEFVKKYGSVVFEELTRVENGGNTNYKKLIDNNDFSEFTERVIFKFEIIENEKKASYQFFLTIDEEKNIKLGTLDLTHLNNGKNDDNKLNFSLSFEEKEGKYFFETKVFSYENGIKIIHEELQGEFNLDEFLSQFFSSAIIPVFKNRSNFIESEYLDNLEYDTVLINFLGLKENNFKKVLVNNSLVDNQKWEIILKNIFNVSKNFYKDYLRTLFDLRSETYVQGYNQKYGLLANNGFKIYPRYFYFSDQYKNLDFVLYSSYKNKFYNTKYGMNFNYDYSIIDSFKITGTEEYVLPSIIAKYSLKQLETVENKKIGYNIFELQAKKENNVYKYYDFNFGIYNWQEITKDGINPDKQWWEYQSESCSWYNVACHIKNGLVWVVNNIPGIKQTNELASGIGKILHVTKELFNGIFEMWKFSPMLYNTIINIFTMIIFMKIIRLL